MDIMSEPYTTITGNWIEEGEVMDPVIFKQLSPFQTSGVIVISHGGRGCGKTTLLEALFKVLNNDEELTPVDMLDAPGLGEIRALKNFDIDHNENYLNAPLTDTRKNWQNKYEKQFGRKGKRK